MYGKHEHYCSVNKYFLSILDYVVQVGVMEGGAEAVAVLPDPARKVSCQLTARREEGDRYQAVLHQEIIQERTPRPRHHRYSSRPRYHHRPKFYSYSSRPMYHLGLGITGTAVCPGITSGIGITGNAVGTGITSGICITNSEVGTGITLGPGITGTAVGLGITLA